MDFVPYILGIVGTVFCALTAVAYNKPLDYIDVFHPVMKHLTTLATGAYFGLWFSNMAALTTLSPLVDTVPGGLAALSEVRSLPFLAFVILGILISVTISLWYLAATMHNRSLPPEAP